MQEVEAVHHCMLVAHPTSDETGCLLTLRSAYLSGGLALDRAGLTLASKAGSEATTVMSARQCVLFRRGLAVELEYVNHQIAQHKVQVRRFQVLWPAPPPPSSLPYTVDTSRPSLRTNWTRLVHDLKLAMKHVATRPAFAFDIKHRTSSLVRRHRAQMVLLCATDRGAAGRSCARTSPSPTACSSQTALSTARACSVPSPLSPY